MRAKCASFETKPEIRVYNGADKKEKDFVREKWKGNRWLWVRAIPIPHMIRDSSKWPKWPPLGHKAGRGWTSYIRLIQILLLSEDRISRCKIKLRLSLQWEKMISVGLIRISHPNIPTRHQQSGTARAAIFEETSKGNRFLIDVCGLGVKRQKLFLARKQIHQRPLPLIQSVTKQKSCDGFEKLRAE